jgi:hypothetical protein
MEDFMKKSLLFLLPVLLLTAAFTALTGWPENVTEIKSEKGKTVTIKGDLKDGVIIEDLSWAANSAVACFPATQNSKFRGHHVLFHTGIPARSIMKITLTPDDVNQDLSLYGYQVGTTNFSVVPNLASCVACEADHKWDRPKKGRTQDHNRSIEFNSIKSPYNIVIGVTGPKEAVSGAFTLAIDLQ